MAKHADVCVAVCKRRTREQLATCAAGYAHCKDETAALAGHALHQLRISERVDLIVVVVGDPFNFARQRQVHSALMIHPPQQALQQQAPFLLACVGFERTRLHMHVSSLITTVENHLAHNVHTTCKSLPRACASSHEHVTNGIWDLQADQLPTYQTLGMRNVCIPQHQFPLE